MDKWCEHITWKQSFNHGNDGKFGYYIGEDWGLGVTSGTMFCPICGTPRPEEPKEKEMYHELTEMLGGDTKEFNDKVIREWLEKKCNEFFPDDFAKELRITFGLSEKEKP